MHTRRGFERAWQAGDSRGGTVLALVQKLYAVLIRVRYERYWQTPVQVLRDQLRA